MSSPTSPPARKRLRRWLLVALGAGTLLVALLLAALPSLISTRFAHDQILKRINANLAPGRLEVDRFEVSWGQPTRLVGFKLISPNGARVVEVPAAELSRNLRQFILQPQGPAVLTLDRAAVVIERQSDGKLDLVEALQTLIAHPDPERDLVIRIVDGALTVRGSGLPEPIVAENAALDLHIQPAPRPLTWTLKLRHAAGGTFVADGDTNRWMARDNNPSLADLRLDLKATRWPIHYETNGIESRGQFDGTVDLGRRLERWSCDANARLLDLRVTGDPLKGDIFQPGPVSLNCDLGQNSGGWTLRKLALESSVGSIHAQGRLGFEPGVEPSTEPPRRIEARLDLAALAQQLPRTLRLQPGLTVAGGTAKVVAEVSGPLNHAHYFLEGTLADLVAHNGDRRLGLRDPASFTVDVVRLGDEVVIEKLTARTSFLNASGKGRLDDASLTGSIDLGALRHQLGDWIDLGSLDGSGQAEIAATYQVKDHRYVGDLQARFRDLKLAGTPLGALERPLTTLNLSVGGRPEATGWPAAWESLEVIATSGTASGRVELHSLDAAVAVGVRLMADLPGLADHRLEASLAGSWNGTGQTLACDRVTARVVSPVTAGQELFACSARGEIDARAGSIRFDPIDSRDLTRSSVRLAPGGLRISGLGRDLAAIRLEARLSGDLPLRDVSTTKPDHWEAMVQAQGSDQEINFSAKGNIEPSAGSVSLVGRYSRTADRVEFSDCRLDSRFGDVTAIGRLDDVGGARRFELQGQVAPDFATVTSWLQEHVEPGAMLTGQGRPFRLAGTLSGVEPLKSIEGDLGINLTEADIYGIKLGPTPLLLRARGGQILVDPISTTLNEGHIRLEPEVVLSDSQGDPILRFGKNSTIRDARINDEVSRRVLAFVAPILEGTTRATGRVSLDLDHAEFPLRSARARRVLVDGQVVFTDVAFAPGPLAEDLLAAIGRRDATLRLDRPVTLTIADGRINQSGLALPIGDLTRIELAGWVDFDRNLALTATLPVTPAMLGNNDFLTDLVAGTQVRLPISGTLNRPQIDQDALTASLKDLGKSLLTRGATRGALELFKRFGQPRNPNTPPPPSAADRRAARQDRKAARQNETNPNP